MSCSALPSETQYSIFYKFMNGSNMKRLSRKYSRPLLEIEQIIREQMSVKPRWSYSPYRAMLRKNGLPWAIVTPEGGKALPDHQAIELLMLLNARNSKSSESAGQKTES